VGLLPWTMLVGAGASATLGGRTGGPIGRAVLIGWSAPVFVMMSLVATKLPHYILPMFPALAMAVAGVIERPDVLTARDRRWLAWGEWAFVLLVGLGALALLSAPAALAISRPPGHPSLRAVMDASVGLGLALLAMVWLQRRLHRVVHLRTRAAELCLSTLAIALALGLLWLPKLSGEQFTRNLAEEINRRFPGVPVATCDFAEPSLLFYLDRPTPIPNVNRPGVRAWAKRNEPGLLITTREEVSKLRAARQMPGRLRRVAHRGGFNYSKGRWCKVLVFERRVGEDQRARP